MGVTEIVDTDRYPLAEPGGDALARRGRAAPGGSWPRSAAACWPTSSGPRCFDALRGRARGPRRTRTTRSRPSTSTTSTSTRRCRTEHPGRVTMQRGNAFVAARPDRPRRRSSTSSTRSELFQQFVADCFELARLYELADPLSALVLNVIRPGLEHPWHFDTNEFTVSLLTQEADGRRRVRVLPEHPVRHRRESRRRRGRAGRPGRAADPPAHAAPGRPAAVQGPVRTAPGERGARRHGPAHGDLRLQRAARRHRQRRPYAAALRPGAARAPAAAGRVRVDQLLD